MKHIKPVLPGIFLLVFIFTGVSPAQEEMRIWNEFVTLWKEGKITEEKIHPYYESFKKPLIGFLQTILDESKPGELDAVPEIFRVENKVHYLLKSSAKGQKVTYCYSLILENDEWYFHHLEAISELRRVDA